MYVDIFTHFFLKHLKYILGYRRTVLVIWPKWSNHDILFGGEGGLAYGVAKLNAIISKEPNPVERALCTTLWRARRRDTFVIRSVCRVARLWKDATLWKHAAQPQSQPITTVGSEEIYEGILTFGWEDAAVVYVAISSLVSFGLH